MFAVMSLRDGSWLLFLNVGAFLIMANYTIQDLPFVVCTILF